MQMFSQIQRMLSQKCKSGWQFSFRDCWYNLFRDVQFAQELFDALISYIKRVVVTFENTSQALYFYMEIFHAGTNFENPEQKRVD